MQVERGQRRLPGFEDGETEGPFAAAGVFETTSEIFGRVFRTIRPRTALSSVHVEYCRFANANSFVRWHEGRLELRITDVLEGAPAPVQEALAYILISKLFRKPVPPLYRHRYRVFLNRQDMRRSLHLLRQARGRKHISGPQGERFNLKEMFAQLNDRFFHGLLAEPELGWSRRASRTLLGHFDPAHNAIILSRLLDSARSTQLMVEYVLYHEMLHLRYPVESAGAKRRVHTKEFKAAEKLFPEMKEAKAQLEQLCGSARVVVAPSERRD